MRNSERVRRAYRYTFAITILHIAEQSDAEAGILAGLDASSVVRKFFSVTTIAISIRRAFRWPLRVGVHRHASGNAQTNHSGHGPALARKKGLTEEPRSDLADAVRPLEFAVLTGCGSVRLSGPYSFCDAVLRKVGSE